MGEERQWRRALRICLVVVTGLGVVLVLTGLVLAFRYRPDVSEAFLAPGTRATPPAKEPTAV